MRTTLLIAVALLGACGGHEGATPPARPTSPRFALEARRPGIGDRLSVSIQYAQRMEASPEERATLSEEVARASMQYEDEIREVTPRGALSIRRHWTGGHPRLQTPD